MFSQMPVSLVRQGLRKDWLDWAERYQSCCGSGGQVEADVLIGVSSRETGRRGSGKPLEKWCS